MTIPVLLVDDHAMLRQGLRALLERTSDIEVIGEAGNGQEALDQIAKRAPKVVVMDIGLRDMNGIEATRRITAKHPQVRVLGLSTYLDRSYVLAMLEAGALGYVVKETAAEDLYFAIRAVANNHRYLSQAVAEMIADSFSGGRLPSSAAYQLSSRERQVLQLLAEGKTSSMIAEQLHLSARTVDAHRRNIMNKLGLHSVAELTKYALREHLTH